MCEKFFPSKVALGGHVSKTHPGQSVNYNKKIKVRTKRAVERECLQEAKKKVLAQNFESKS